MNDHRGISLMPTVLKLLISLLARRLYKACEGIDTFHKGQGGFRSKEECVLQVAALHDIKKRRDKKGHRTHILFVDIQKAYDTVPHHLLFMKLRYYGVRGKIFNFFRALYRGSIFKVRSGGGRGNLSEVVQLLRGLRQGCPASPVLFNIFINDIFWPVSVTELGVEVTIKRRTPWTGDKVRIEGLLFADDLVALGKSWDQLRSFCDHLGAWSRANDMAFGIKKCGVMASSPSDHEALLEIVKDQPFLLNGDVVPVVTEYQYIGLMVNSKFDLDYMADCRANLGRLALQDIKAILGYSKVPIHIKAKIIKAVLVPKMLYGAELWGTDKKRVNKAQQVIDEALRICLGAKAKDKTLHMAGLWRECNIPPLACTAKGKVCRGIIKASGVRTFINDLTGESPSSLLRMGLTDTWAYKAGHLLTETIPKLAATYLSRIRGTEQQHRPITSKLSAGDVQTLQDLTTAKLHSIMSDLEEPVGPPRLVARLIESFLWQLETWEICTKKPGLRAASYRTAGYPNQGSGRECMRQDTRVAVATSTLARLRMNSYWTGRDLAKKGLWPSAYNSTCPCCDMNVAETREHLVLRCHAFDEERQVIRDLIRIATRICPAPSGDEDILVLTLGGASRKGGGAPISVGSFNKRHLPRLLTFLSRVARRRPKFIRAKSLAASMDR
jgi:hypothetical protein